MGVEVTLEFVWENYAIAQELNRAGAKDATIKQGFEARLAFRISRLVSAMRPHYEEIAKRKDALIEKFGKKNEKGIMSIEGGTPDFIAANKEFEEMVKKETVTLDVKPVELPEAADMPGFVFNLYPLVTTKE